MKKFTLIAMAAVAGMFTASAQNTLHLYGPDNNLSYGTLYSVSGNGLWAVGCDDAFQTGSFMVDVVNNPAELIEIPGGELYDIANDGTAVGAWYENQGTAENPVLYARAAYYKDGEWVRLEEPADVFGRSYARCISNDGKVIGGIINCRRADSEMGARWYPAVWRWDDEYSDYVLTCYSDLDMPANQGFTVNAMSEDGSILAGSVFAHAGSLIPAIVRDGQLKIWNNVEWKPWPYEYKGQVTWYDTAFIDGIEEGADDDLWFYGGFNSISGDYIFGHRSIASNVDYETARGTVTHHRTIYNIATDEFTDTPGATVFSHGYDADHAFIIGGSSNTTAYYYNNGRMQTLAKAFGLEGDVEMAVVYASDEATKVLVGSAVAYNEVVGLYETPAMVVLDTPVIEGAGVNRVDADFTLPTDPAYYDLSGRRFDKQPAAPGIYIHNGQKVVIK